MSGIQTIEKAQYDVERMQSALGSVQAGLGAVETVAETATEVRRGLRRLVKVALVLVVVGMIAAIVLQRRGADEPEIVE